jgi:hypothetical protein
LDALTSPVLQRLQVTESLLNSADPVSVNDPIGSIATLVSLVARSKCNLRELRVLGSGFSPLRYHEALPSVTSFIFNNGGKLDIPEPFLEEVEE